MQLLDYTTVYALGLAALSAASPVLPRNVPPSVLASLASVGGVTATGSAAAEEFRAYVSRDSVIFNPAPTIEAQLATIIPYTVVERITVTPSAYFEFIDELGSKRVTPDWLSSLEPSVQSFVFSYYDKEACRVAELHREAKKLHITNPGPIDDFAAQTPTVQSGLSATAPYAVISTTARHTGH